MRPSITCQVYRAADLGGVKPPDVVIEISGNVELAAKAGNSLEDVAKFYDKEADRLSEALFRSLPQGTTDRLLIRLMQRKLSSYMGVTGT